MQTIVLDCPKQSPAGHGQATPVEPAPWPHVHPFPFKHPTMHTFSFVWPASGQAAETATVWDAAAD